MLDKYKTLGDNTPEQVAYKLMQDCTDSKKETSLLDLSKAEILDLYAECLLAVRSPDDRSE